MTTYNTGNPIGSTDARDLLDNAQALDEAINSTAATFTDRLGNVRKPLAKAMQDIEVAGTTYATTAAGLAGTTNGQYFTVPAGTTDDSLILYQHSSGTAVEVKRYPSTEKLEPFLNIAPAGYAWALVDENGVASFGLLNDGTLRASKIIADEASATRQKLGVDNVIAAAPTGYVWALVDQYGNAAIAIRSDGAVLTNDLLVTTINGVRSKRITDLAGVQPGNYSAEINHVISYGQSLSLGVGGTQDDLQTTTQEYDSLMFNAGVRAYEGAGTVADNHASLIPLIENYYSSQGETPVGQSAAMIKKLIMAENGISHTAQSYKILGSASGVSATAISGLGRGSTGYTRLINDVTYGAMRSADLSAPYAVQAVYWSQGEQDYAIGTSYALYLASMETLYQHLNTDIKAASGQLNDIKMIGYQCFQSGSSPATVALAQLQASKNNPNIIIACPNYHIDHIPGNVHLNGAGYGMLGAYFGLVYKRVIVDGLAWKPLSPLSVTRQGSIAAIKFHVPVRPLELDATAFAAQANSGFSMIDAGGAAIAITSVSIIGPDTVKIVAAAPLTAGCKIRYGFSGGGNLRDSQGYEIFVQQRARRPLHNWCVAFEETIS